MKSALGGDMVNVLQKVRKVFIVAALAVGLAFGSVAMVAAQGAAGGAADAVCEGITAGGGACADDGGGLSNVIATVIRVLSIVVGVAAVIMIIVGGLRYVTSGGDASKTASAKNTIIFAIVGLIIVAFAQFIVRFVLSSATGAEGGE